MENKEPNSNTNTIDDDLCNDTNSFPTSRPNLQDDTENTPPLQNDNLNPYNTSSTELNEITTVLNEVNISTIEEIAEEAIISESVISKESSSLPLSPPVNNASTTHGNNSQTYRLKVISWRKRLVPIVTQNQNGPCPLIAIVNVLLLRRKIFLPLDMQSITSEQLMDHIGEQLLENTPQNLKESRLLDYQKNMEDAINIIPRLNTGLDVNIKFTGVQDFEYTTECIIFDLLNIPLYHGWLVDPQAKETVKAISNLGYNQLVEKIIINSASENDELTTQALIAQQFLEKTASQLTYHGLLILYETMKSDELAVLFRNNHFSTILKTKNELFQLVTDQGFLHEELMVWETLSNIDGAEFFVDSQFSSSPLKTNSSYSISDSTTQQHTHQKDEMSTSSKTTENNPTTSRNTTSHMSNRKKEMCLFL